MSLSKLITDYLDTLNDKQVQLAQDVILAMQGNAFFSDGAELIAPVLLTRDSLVLHIEEFPHPDESQNATRDLLRKALMKSVSSVAITGNQRYAGNTPALLSTSLRLAATPHPLAPPSLIATFTLADSERAGYIRVSAVKERSTDLLLFRHTTDATFDPKNFEVTLTGETFIEVLVAEGEKLRVMVAAVNKATRADNINFTAIKTRIGQ